MDINANRIVVRMERLNKNTRVSHCISDAVWSTLIQVFLCAKCL